MKTITKKIDLYEYNELDEKIKSDLLEKEVQKECDSYCEGCLLDDAKILAGELLEKNYKNANIENIKVFYDLDYSQGSGAMIAYDLSISNCDLLLKEMLYKRIINKKQYENIESMNITLQVKHSSNYYCHEKSYSYELDFEIQKFSYKSLQFLNSITTDLNYKIDNNLIDNIYNFLDDYFNNKIYGINKEFTEILYKYIDYSNFTDIAKENLKERYYFDITGNIIDYK